jgi:hypothetical protein
VALGRIDDALRTAKTLFAMSRHLGEHPTLIGGLVGISIIFGSIGPLEEVLQQPGCPNLYWALTNLPRPLIPLEHGIEGERLLVLAEFRDLDETAPMSAERLNKFVEYMDRLLGDGKPVKTEQSRVRAWMNARAKKDDVVRAARRRLVDYGLPEERLLRFPPEQVILLDEKREYEVRRDDGMKLWNLPLWVSEARTGPAKPKHEPSLFDEALLSGLDSVHRAQARLDQRIGLLRQVEAIRMHAAAHQGALPKKLEEISVPLSDDPVTGKPFRYELVGSTGHLRGTPPSGLEKDPFFNIHYEVTIQR